MESKQSHTYPYNSIQLLYISNLTGYIDDLVEHIKYKGNRIQVPVKGDTESTKLNHEQNKAK